jgi:hypothetical protein
MRHGHSFLAQQQAGLTPLRSFGLPMLTGQFKPDGGYSKAAARHLPAREADFRGVLGVSVMRRRMRWGRLMRRAGLDANPLRRSSDRTEAWIRLSIVVVFLIAGPLAAISVGHWASTSGAAAARAQAAAEHRIQAVLLSNAPAASSYPVAGSSVAVWVRARWTAPDGASRTGDVQATAGARAGDTVTVYSDASGTLAGPPIGPAQILSRVITFVAVTFAALAILVLSALWLTRRALDRRRLAAWERGWTAVEPQWTRRH